jgi:hypothetical protein
MQGKGVKVGSLAWESLEQMCDESDPVDRWSAEAGGKKDN